MNKDNLSALWDEITPKLYGYLVNTLRDKSLAEDILQNAWLKAIEGISRYRESDAGFSAWLFAIARNECRQHWRKSGREVPFDPALHDKEEASSGQEDKIFLEQVLAKMSADDCELLRLRYIAGLPLNQIAKILKINGVTVRVRMHRAIAGAKTLLQK